MFYDQGKHTTVVPPQLDEGLHEEVPLPGERGPTYSKKYHMRQKSDGMDTPKRANLLKFVFYIQTSYTN